MAIADAPEMFLVTDMQGNHFEMTEERTRLVLEALSSMLGIKRQAFAGLVEMKFRHFQPKDFAIPQLEELINLFGG